MRQTPISAKNRIRTGFTSPPIRLSPADRVLIRTACWRPACRTEFPAHHTIIVTITGMVVAFCHRRIHDDLGYRADLWKYGEVAA